MPRTFSGTVRFENAGGDTLVIIDPDALPTPIILQDALGNHLLEITSSAGINLGGGGEDGNLSLRLADGTSQTIHLAADGATISAGGNLQDGLLVLQNANGDAAVSASALTADIVAGGNGADGGLVLHRAAATETEDYDQAAIYLDAESGAVDLRDDEGRLTLRIQGDGGDIRAGGTPDADGDLLLFRRGEGIDLDNDSQAAIHANADRGRITFRNEDGQFTMRLDGDGGNIRAGGAPGIDGDLLLFRAGEDVDIDDTAQAAIYANAGNAGIDFRDAQGRLTMRLQGDTGDIRAGGEPGVDGDVVLFRGGEGININNAAQSAIHMDAGDSSISLRNADGDLALRISGESGNIRAGGVPGADGDLLLFRAGEDINPNDASQSTIHADGGSGMINFHNPDGALTLRLDGNGGNIRVGGAPDVDGDLLLFRSGNGINIGDASQSAIHADADGALISFHDAFGNTTMRLEGENGNIRAGGTINSDGDLMLFRSGFNIDTNDASLAAVHADADGGVVNFRDEFGLLTMRFDINSGNIRLGGTPITDGDLLIFPSGGDVDINDNSQAAIHLSGDTGDIILRNADCAEEFDISPSGGVQAGAVMVLNDDGLLQPSSEAYDKRVVGVVSGAGAFKPGIVLDKQPDQANRMPIALMGKVFCQVTAESEPVEVGDLLTTSAVAGFAMKASDPERAFGSVVGKALKPLPGGRGIIPVLVTLQ